MFIFLHCICIEFQYVYFPVQLCLSVSVKWLAVKTAYEMTYCVSGGPLNYSLTLIDRSAAHWHTQYKLESRLPCTVGLGTGLPCWRLSAGCWFRTEIPAVRGATCLLYATSEQHFWWPIILCDTGLSLTTCNEHLKTYRVLRPQRIWDIYDFFFHCI